jgi:hypothetical protein
MSDAGEGLVDAEARLQERMEERQRERAAQALRAPDDPERVRLIESLRLARAELARQFAATEHPVRRDQIALALAEVGKRLQDLGAAAATVVGG